MPQENLNPFFKYFADEPHQAEAVQLLQSAMPDSLLQSDSPWIVKYREKAAVPHLDNPLQVDYDSQLDNPGTEGWRECFSSSCAMAAKYWGAIKEFNEYHHLRPKYGDSTDPSAQIRTLQALGLSAKFVQVGSIAMLKEQIDNGYPTPVGYLHHGTPQSASGGGHFCLVVGYDATGFWMNDPYGLCDVDGAGGFVKQGGTSGKMVHYSYKGWGPRWTVANAEDGWGMAIKPGK